MSYQVQSTGVYTSASSGIRYWYEEDAVLADTVAYDLGMPGATLPDDAWQPCVPGGADPADDINMMFNGRFESALLGPLTWYGLFGGDVVSRETTAPLTGTGSLKVVATEEPGSGVAHDIPALNDTYYVETGDTLTFSFLARAEPAFTLQVVVYGDGAWVGSPVWTFDLTATATVFTESFVMPAGNNAFSFNFWTMAETGAVTFWLDDITLLRTA